MLKEENLVVGFDGKSYVSQKLNSVKSHFIKTVGLSAVHLLPNTVTSFI
jgi:hypothetical protein